MLCATHPLQGCGGVLVVHLEQEVVAVGAVGRGSRCRWRGCGSRLSHHVVDVVPEGSAPHARQQLKHGRHCHGGASDHSEAGSHGPLPFTTGVHDRPPVYAKQAHRYASSRLLGFQDRVEASSLTSASCSRKEGICYHLVKVWSRSSGFRPDLGTAWSGSNRRAWIIETHKVV